jgi:enoyl reductase-like protein
LLYSIYPPEVVFADSNGQETSTSAMPGAAPSAVPGVTPSTMPELIGSAAGWGRYAEIERDGVRIIVYKSNGRKAKVVRLISTDPRDYLDPRYSPGADIEL